MEEKIHCSSCSTPQSKGMAYYISRMLDYDLLSFKNVLFVLRLYYSYVLFLALTIVGIHGMVTPHEFIWQCHYIPEVANHPKIGGHFRPCMLLNNGYCIVIVVYETIMLSFIQNGMSSCDKLRWPSSLAVTCIILLHSRNFIAIIEDDY